jgi:sporulation protein YlmC with PRC-barrel domain
MNHKLAFSLLACLAATSCAPMPPPEVASRINFNAGIWDNEPLVPPAGYITVTQGSALIGAPLYDSTGMSVASINYLLADPVTGQAHYIVVSSPALASYVIVPIAALQISPDRITADVPQGALMRLPRLQADAFVYRYPRTAMAMPLVAPLTPVAVAVVLPPALPPMAPAVEPLNLMSRGSIVGYTVFDANGQPVGTVNAVSARPGTGEIRYVVVASPNFGFDNFIVIPAPNAQARGNNSVVLTASAGNWMQAPRYNSGQLRQMYGSSGVY